MTPPMHLWRLPRKTGAATLNHFVIARRGEATTRQSPGIMYRAEKRELHMQNVTLRCEHSPLVPTSFQYRTRRLPRACGPRNDVLIEKKSAFVPILRDKGANYLCGTTLVPLCTALDSALSGGPGAVYSFRFGALLGGDTEYVPACCLSPTGSSLEAADASACPRQSVGI